MLFVRCKRHVTVLTGKFVAAGIDMMLVSSVL